MTITVKRGGEVSVTVPFWVSYKKGREFAIANKEWIFKKIKKIKEKGDGSLLEQGTKEDYRRLKKEALCLVLSIIEKYNKHYRFSFRRIFIRNQKTRWGSCSGSKNLNFNYRIVKLPKDQAQYLVVHELCHLKQMNHSKKFWDLVEQTIPNCKKIAKDLRRL